MSDQQIQSSGEKAAGDPKSAPEKDKAIPAEAQASSNEDPQKLLQSYDPRLEQYAVGQYIDCFDQNNWCVAIITGIDKDKISIHFDGWAKKYDEAGLSVSSQRLAPFRKRTTGYTGQKKGPLRDFVYSKKEVAEISEKMKEFIGKKFCAGFSAREITDFVRGRLFFFVDSLVTLSDLCKIPDTDIKDTFIGFMELLIEFIIAYFKVFPEYLKDFENASKYPYLYRVSPRAATACCCGEIISMMNILLGLASRAVAGVKYICGKLDAETKSKAFPEIQAKDQVLYIAHLYFAIFKRKGGVDLVESMISTAQKNAYPIILILDFLRSFSFLFDNQKQLDAEFQSFTTRIADLLTVRFGEFTEKDLNEINEMPSGLFLKKIIELIKFGKPSKAKEISNKMELQLLLSLIKNPSVVRKLQGFKMLKENYDLDSLLKENQQELKKGAFAKIEPIAKLFKEINLIDILFNQYPHPEIIKMSGCIISLLLISNQEISLLLPPEKSFFSASDLTCLLDCYKKKHEEMKVPMLKLFAGMPQFAPCWVLSEIFSLVKPIPIVEYTEHQIEFVGTYTRNLLKVLEKKKKDYKKKLDVIVSENKKKSKKGEGGVPDVPKELEIEKWDLFNLNILWDIVMNDISKTKKKIDANLKELAAKYLIECILENSEYLKAYSERCIKSICDSSNIDCMKLLMQVNEKLRQLDKKNLPFEGYNKSYHVLDCVIKNLCKYLVQTISNRQKEALKQFMKNGVLNVEFIPGVRHEDYLRTVFEFLEYVVTELGNEVAFTEDHLSMLWDAFIINKAFPEESNYLYLNLLKTTSKPNADNVKYLFLKKELAQKLFIKFLRNSSEDKGKGPETEKGKDAEEDQEKGQEKYKDVAEYAPGFLPFSGPPHPHEKRRRKQLE